MDFLQSIIDNPSSPILYAFVLGLVTAISPCPLAANITATAYISKDIVSKKIIFLNGIVYTAGRAFTYTVLGLILYFGANTFNIARFIQHNGERYFGPFLVISGILMFNFIKIKLPTFGKLSDKLAEKKNMTKLLNSFLLGVVFAFAFCSYSAVLYFGMLIPITIASPSGLYLPLIYAIGTGLPVILVAYLIAFTVSGVASFYNKMQTFEKWFRYVAAVVFIIIGLYYIKIYYL